MSKKVIEQVQSNKQYVYLINLSKIIVDTSRFIQYEALFLFKYDFISVIKNGGIMIKLYESLSQYKW